MLDKVLGLNIYLLHGWKYNQYSKQQSTAPKRGIRALYPRYHP